MILSEVESLWENQWYIFYGIYMGISCEITDITIGERLSELYGRCGWKIKKGCPLRAQCPMARSGRTLWFVGRTTSVHSKIAGKYAHVHWSSLICWTRPTYLSAVALYISCSYFVHRPFIFVRAPLTVDLAVIPPYEAISGHHPWPSPSGTGETVGTSGWSLEGGKWMGKMSFWMNLHSIHFCITWFH